MKNTNQMTQKKHQIIIREDSQFLIKMITSTKLVKSIKQSNLAAHAKLIKYKESFLEELVAGFGC